ncbi:MAG: MAPEG family protein [Rhizobiaceae bacterium]|nr:MAPEG family protein [Rhizobiaceae bacterium]MCV0407936.1 MAPEG family protein [Rhizobiaceae bacterium]
MIAHVALVYGIYVMMFLRRREAVRSGAAKVSQFRENTSEPPQSLFVRNSLANQFELPVLFHIGCLALYATNGATFVAVIVAWIFVASRYVHAFIHVTTNRIRWRRPAFTLGFLANLVLWIMLAIRIAAA